MVEAGGDNATDNAKHAVNGVWERVGLIWAERANIGFSTPSAPAKARRMCQGISLGRSVGAFRLYAPVSVCLSERGSLIQIYAELCCSNPYVHTCFHGALLYARIGVLRLRLCLYQRV